VDQQHGGGFVMVDQHRWKKRSILFEYDLAAAAVEAGAVAGEAAAAPEGGRGRGAEGGGKGAAAAEAGPAADAAELGCSHRAKSAPNAGFALGLGFPFALALPLVCFGFEFGAFTAEAGADAAAGFGARHWSRCAFSC
jgi:hypothetical protein